MTTNIDDTTSTQPPPFQPWILGDATYGVVGVTTAPASEEPSDGNRPNVH